jgi:hypothetical protein
MAEREEVRRDDKSRRDEPESGRRDNPSSREPGRQSNEPGRQGQGTGGSESTPGQTNPGGKRTDSENEEE